MSSGSIFTIIATAVIFMLLLITLGLSQAGLIDARESLANLKDISIVLIPAALIIGMVMIYGRSDQSNLPKSQ